MKKYKFPLSEVYLDKEEKSLLNKFFNSKILSSIGPYVSKFENDFANYIGCSNSISVSNGTVAIELALKSLPLKPGTEIIVPNLTFAATINAIINSGFKPVLTDISIDDWNIDINELKKNISKKTSAILVVHLYGIPNKLDEIKKIAKKNKLFIVEDCAESLGTKVKNFKIGLVGDAATFSFYPNKLITTGEGGIAIFKNKKYYNKALQIRNQGRSRTKTYWHDYVGSNYRFTNLQASIGISQLKKISKLLKIRKKIFQTYIKLLSKNKKILFIPTPNDSENSYWLFTIRILNFNENKRNKFSKFLFKKGIENRPMFYPLNKMSPYMKYSKGKFKNSELISYQSISLPTSIFLNYSDLKKICDTILNYLHNN